MAYSLLSDVEIAVGGPEKLVELADLDEDAVADPAVVARAIATADGVINSYLGKRFAVPLEVVPDSISTLSASWAARVLRRYRYNGQPMVDDIDQEKIDREWLVGVSQGDIALGIEPVPSKASMVIDKAAPRDSTLAVSNQRMKGFI